MQPFDTLIKAAKHDLDEKRRQLAILVDREETLKEKIAEVDQQILNEAEFARQDAMAAMQYPAYVNGARLRQEHWQAEIDKFRPALEEAQDALADAFQDLKRLEITNDMKEEEARRERDAKTQAELDEIGMNLHRRNKAAAEHL